VLCVRWCLFFKLSSRDLVEMIGECEIELAHARHAKLFTFLPPE
jgi:hypothetical protein